MLRIHWPPCQAFRGTTSLSTRLVRAYSPLPHCTVATPPSCTLQFQRYNSSSSSSEDQPFFRRLRTALSATKIEWYPLTVALGIGFLGFIHYRKVRDREIKIEEEEAQYESSGDDGK